MNQNQREGLLVWLHTRTEKFAIHQHQKIKERIGDIVKAYFKDKDIEKDSKALKKLDATIKATEKRLEQMRKQRREQVVQVFKLCGIEKDPGRYSPNFPNLGFGEDVKDVIARLCQVNVSVTDPRGYQGTIQERYINGGIKINLNTPEGAIREFMRNALTTEIKKVEKAEAFRADAILQAMLLEDIPGARLLVADVKTNFKI